MVLEFATVRVVLVVTCGNFQGLLNHSCCWNHGDGGRGIKWLARRRRSPDTQEGSPHLLGLRIHPRELLLPVHRLLRRVDEPSELPQGPAARGQQGRRERRHQLAGHELHHAARRRLPRRCLPRQILDHRALHGHLRRGLRGAHGERGGGAGERGLLRGAVPAGAGRRAAAGAVVVRRGPVRRGGARAAELLLQLVLPLHQRRLAGRRHRAGVGAVQRRLGARVRHPGALQRPGRRGVPGRHHHVPTAPAAGRQPAHQGRAGYRRRGQEVRRPGAGRRVDAARVRGRRRHVRDTGEPPARAHRSVQVPGQGSGGDGGRQGGASVERVASVHGDAGGGAQVRAPAAAGVGERHHLRGGVHADDHHLHPAGGHAGPVRGRLPRARRRALRLRHPQRHAVGAALRPPRGPAGAARHGARARVHAAGAHGRGPRRAHARHARRGGAGGGAARRHRAPRHVRHQHRRRAVPAAVHLLAGAAVRGGGRVRGVHVHRADGVLLRPGARRDAEPLLGPLHDVLRARELRQLRARHRGGARHRAGWPGRVDPRRHQPGAPRLLLLAARHAVRRQLRRLPAHRAMVHVQEDRGLI